MAIAGRHGDIAGVISGGGRRRLYGDSRRRRRLGWNDATVDVDVIARELVIEGWRRRSRRQRSDPSVKGVEMRSHSSLSEVLMAITGAALLKPSQAAGRPLKHRPYYTPSAGRQLKAATV